MDIDTVDKLLTTTRTVRKRLDLERPLDLDVLYECLEIAIQAPTGSNLQGWRFMVVTDEAKREAIAGYYRQSWQGYVQQVRSPARTMDSDHPRAARASQTLDSAAYLAENLHKVPVLIIPCVKGRVETEPVVSQASLYGSILPATWSLMLALRSRGIGAAWTTLHLAFERQVGELLGIPENYTQAALLPVAYYTGEDFRPAHRVPAKELTYVNEWSS